MTETEMRRFRVGDRVKVKLEEDGEIVDGLVTSDQSDLPVGMSIVSVSVKQSRDIMFSTSYVELVEAVEDQQLPKLVEPRPGYITDVMLQRSGEIKNGAHDLTCDCGACPKIEPRPKDEPTKTVTVDQVAEMVWTRLSHRIDEIIDAGVSYRNDRFRGVKVDKYHEVLIKECARAIAEALVGVKVTR